MSRVVSPRDLHTPKPVSLVSPGLARHKGQNLNAFADDIVILLSASKSVGEPWVKQLLLPPPPFKSQPPAAADILLAGAAGRPQLLVPLQFTHHHSEDLSDVTLSLSATA